MRKGTVAVVVSVLLVVACAERNGGLTKEGRMAEADPMYDFRNEVLKVVGAYREVDFVPTPNFAELPAHVFFKSASWAEEVFRKGLGPFDAAGAAHSYHLAGADTLDFDLVRHTYQAGGCTVEIREGAGFYKIRFSAYDPRSFGGTDPLKQAERLAETFFNMEPPVFRYLPGDSGPTPVMSSSAGKTLTDMDRWSDRLDAIRTTNGVIMVIYKIHFELEEMIDFNKWFPEDFRRDPKREKGRDSDAE